MGRIRLSASRLLAATTPRGSPMDTAMRTATTIRAMVSMVFGHRPIKPMNSSASKVNITRLKPRTAKDKRTRPTTMVGHGVHFNTSSMYTSA